MNLFLRTDLFVHIGGRYFFSSELVRLLHPFLATDIAGTGGWQAGLGIA